MTKLQNVGGYGILAIPTLPAIIVFFHAICENSGVHLSPLGFAACQSKKCTNRANSFLPQISQNFLAVVSPTDFTELTELSCCSFSHRFHRFHRTFLL